MIKTVIGSFDSFEEAREVVRDLKDEGFMESDISIVASNTSGNYAGSDESSADRDGNLDPSLTGDTAREPIAAREPIGARSGLATSADSTAPTRTSDVTGAATGAVAGGVLGGAAGVAVSLMGLAIPGIGPIIAGLTGAGVGAVAGGLIGGLTSLGVSEEHAEYYAESVRRGGALVTIRCDETRAERAAQTMQDHGAVDIERRVESWRDTGWSGYDQNAQPYSADQVAKERSSYPSSTSSDARSSRSRAAGDWTLVEPDFRREHEHQYAGQSANFDDYAPAYRYGYETAQKDTYRGRNWDDVETDLRGDWERSNPGHAWDNFKAAVRRGWDRLTGDTPSMGRGSESSISPRTDTTRR
jgi:hypothetical protein